MGAIAVIIGGFVASLQPGLVPNVVMASFAAAFITGAGNIVNDIYDIKIDKINAPKRPLPSGEITKKEAIFLSFALFLSGLIISYYINLLCFILAFFNSLILIFYARNLKGTPLVGNISIGYLVGSTFLFGGFAVGVGEGIEAVSFLFLLAAFSTMGREVSKDIEDLLGDRDKVSTVATKYGIDISVNFSLIFTLIAVVLSPIPYFIGLFGVGYLGLVIVADLIFLSSSYRLAKEKNISEASRFQKNSKLAMLIALLAFIFGTIL